jgi:hypothetical protein
VLEFHIREFVGHAQRWVHEAERCGKDQVRPLKRHLRDRALGISAFGHAFLIDRFDRVAEMLFNGQSTLVMLIGPATVPDGPDIDEADLGLVLCQSGRGKAKGQCGACEKSGDGHGVLPYG